jgi:hypothetical protein
MSMIVGLNASFDNMLDWRGIWQKVGEVNSKKALTNDEK